MVEVFGLANAERRLKCCLERGPFARTENKTQKGKIPLDGLMLLVFQILKIRKTAESVLLTNLDELLLRVVLAFPYASKTGLHWTI